jgi:polysaccharide biosynthesis/export protein
MSRVRNWTVSVGYIVLLSSVSVAQMSEQATSVPDERAQPAQYILGPDDQVVIHVLDTDEIGDKPFTIDMRGNINVPLAGRFHAGGLTVDQFEVALADHLKRYLQTPVVTASVAEFRSQPVSVLGAVAKPGSHQFRGRKTLFEAISESGGLSNEAGNNIKITRRKEFGPIPLPGAEVDASGEYWVGQVTAKSVVEARNPQENIQIKPNDVISVPRAELIYVIGAVRHAGGFVLGERDHMTVLQALSMAEGLDKVAAPGSAKILRAAGSDRQEISVNLNKILAGKTSDVFMVANDILFIPNSATRSATIRGIEAAVQIGTGVVIWRR